MIDPRTQQVAMLPILNAVAAHLITIAAPLRKANVEDTEQMLAEAAEAGAFDLDRIEAEIAPWTNGTLWEFSEHVALHFERCEIEADTLCFFRTLECVIDEAV